MNRGYGQLDGDGIEANVYSNIKHWAVVIPTEAWAGGIAGLVPASGAAACRLPTS